MLINYSNHLSTNWPQNQFETAIKQFGRVIDEPFPFIDPEWDEREVMSFAKKESERLLNKYSAPFSVHLMGELTFTFLLVQLLTRHNIECYASTTRRVTSERTTKDKTIRTSEFQFVRFRKYQSL